MIECMLSLEILSMRVSSSPFLYLSTVDRRGHELKTVAKYTSKLKQGSPTSVLEGDQRVQAFAHTQVLPPLVFIYVDIDLFDGQQCLGQ